MTATASNVLVEMLTENTGRHMCDSGGEPKYDADGNYVGSSHGYGRQYERNAHRDFDAEPEVHLHIDASGIEVAVSTYHYLKEHLEECDWLQTRLDEFAERPDQKDNPWLCTMEALVNQLSLDGNEVTGLYGDGDPMTVNTYNHESLLDQTIQYVYFEMDGESYVLLQIHGGCDVRGGYTRPRAFKVSDYDSASFFCDRDATIQCDEDHEHYWRTDDGYHWYAEGACGSGAGTQLEDYDRDELEDDVEDGLPAVLAAKLQDDPKLFFTPNGTGFCPICGGRLSAGMH